jgi:hypothetical protein
VSRDGERLIELVNELGTRISHAFSDMVPPSAQVHLLNAQRELITALMLIYEHRVTAGPTVQTRRRAATPRRTTAASRSAARRSRKIPIE